MLEYISNAIIFDSRKRTICDHKYVMLELLTTTGEYHCTVTIKGPVGVIEIHDLVWCPPNRQDLLEIYYWESWAVLNGAYHCCFSIPGKVVLLNS